MSESAFGALQSHLFLCVKWAKPILRTEKEKRCERRRREYANDEREGEGDESPTNWFALGKNADSFRRNALSEVDKVVRRATALAASARPSANYAANLNTLAHQLLLAR